MTADLARYDPGTPTNHTCQRCGFTVSRTPQMLRVQGWRVWTGSAVSGADLSVIVCPTCFDGTPAEAGEERGGYDAECTTCGASMSEDEDEEDGGEPFTKKDAENWRYEHDCEPDVQIIEPKRAERAKPVPPLINSTRSL